MRIFAPLTALSLAFAALLPCRVAAESLLWEPLHEPACGGWVTGFRFSPRDSKRILVTGDMLGAGLSEDGGASWGATFGFKSWELGDVSWCEADPKLLWIGAVSGPYVSTDGGRHWTLRRDGLPAPLGFGNSAPIEKVLIDPQNANHLLAFGGSSRRWDDHGKGAKGIVWESRNAGAHWDRLATLTEQGSSNAPDARGFNIVSAAYVPGHFEQLYAAVDGRGIYVSTDAGKTWSIRNEGLATRHPERVIAHPREKDTLFCSLGNERMRDSKDFQPGGIFKSTDAGAHWQALNNGLRQNINTGENFTARYKAFALCASKPEVMYAANDAWFQGGIFVTKDGGEHWKESDLTLEKYFPAAVPGTVMEVDPKNPDVAWCLGAETMLLTTDGGEHWRDAGSLPPSKTKAGWRGTGYSGMCATQVRFNPAVSGEAMLQALDCGRAWLSHDGMQTWTRHLNEPDPWGAGNDTAFAGPKVIYVSTSRDHFTGIGRSRDGGATWTMLAGKSRGLPEMRAPGDALGIYAQPDAPDQVWACIGGHLCQSKDGGDNWIVIHSGPDLRWIAADPKNSHRFFVSGGKNVYLYDDGKITALGGPHTPGRLAVDGLGRLLVTAAGGSRNGLWRYDGAAWTRLLDDPFVEAVAVDPSTPERIAVATNQNPYLDFCGATGVWISADGGKTWSVQNEGLAMLRGYALAFNPHNPGQLVFGAQGRGFFVTRWPITFNPKGARAYASTADDSKFAAVAPEAP